MTRPFSIAYKQRIVERLTGKNAESARQVALKTGISPDTTSRWLREARSLASMPVDRRKNKSWTIDEKIRVLAAASKLTGAELTGFLERENLSLAELEQWRMALDVEGRASLVATKRIRQLERELAHKEKALAEVAALLVLKKKVQHLWGEEDDDTDKENEK